MSKSRWSARRAALCAPAVLAAAAIGASAPAASAARSPEFAQGHAWRHGVVPPRPGIDHQGSNPPPAGAASGTNDLSFGGGVNGVGVTTGAPHMYLVFWGSQWGTQGTNSSGYATFSGDTKGVAPDLQGFFKGIGTGNDLWSGVMTQYCEGVPTGSQTCPSSASHVGYPTGGALAGVWVDESSSAPSQATQTQLANEALKAANHFMLNSTSGSRNSQYFIVSPHGTKPDGFNTPSGGFCAWHDSAGSGSDQVAYTNMPYVPDAGASCGASFVNAGTAGALDGVTIVGGHEYAETITDQFPVGGWLDSSGAENGDKCAWIKSGQGASQNLTLTTGTFAVQSTWANDFNGGAGGCEVSHPIVTSGGGGGTATVTVTNPGNQTGTVGTVASLQIHASDSDGGALTYSATGLPAGLTINSSNGLISGTPTTATTYTVTVTATDASTGNPTGSTAFSWTINPSSGGGCTAKQLFGNPGFETGTAAPWTSTAAVINSSAAGQPAHSGTYLAWLDGYGTTHTDTLAQTVSIPSGCSQYTLSYWLHIDTAERTTTTAYDTMRAQILSTGGTVLSTLATYSNLNAAAGYQQRTFNVSAFAGQTVTIKFTGTEDSSLETSFVIDDTALNVS